MSLIIRTWGCQNKACSAVFDSDKRAPACPRCGCVRVGWVPGRVNIGSERTRGMDTTLRDLAQHFGLTDLASAREGEAVKKPPAARPAPGGLMNFQGFAANIDPNAGAQCVPTANHVSAKVKPGVGAKLTGQLGMPGVAAATSLEASHRGKA